MPHRIRIWDLPTRIFHWLLALCVIGLVVSAKLGLMDWHFRLGYTVLTLLLVLTIVVDLAASILGARRVGASRKAMIGAGVGAVAGMFFGLPGLLLGPYVGAVGGEMAHGTDWKAASRIGLGAWLGLAVGSVVKLLIAGVMLVVFALAMWVL